jgi:Protein of unknown function (DUF1573)
MTIRWFTILIAVLLTQMAFAAVKDPEPALTPSEQMWIFGMIPQDGRVSHHYVLTNPHTDTVTILKIESDCDCTRVPKGPVAIPPGTTYLLPVIFDTRTYFGQTNRDIKLVTDYAPNPDLTIYFTSFTSRLPGSITISPPSTAFIRGKDAQAFTITNVADEKTDFTILIDHDSSLTVSPASFTLGGKQQQEIKVSPLWDRFPKGEHYRCLVVEAARKERFRVSIPIKVNKF